MATFVYKVVDPDGKQITGEQEANSENAIARFLHEQNYVVLSIEEKVDFMSELFSTGVPQVSLKGRVVFANQMATMMGAGLALTKAMEIIIQQTKEPALQKNLHDVLEDIQASGRSLSSALAARTKMFNEVQINLLKAGEESGNLYEILVKISDDLEKSKKLQGKIKGAMIYPIIIFVIIAIVMAVMMIYMIPAIEDLYANFGIKELPAITAFLVSISNFLTSPFGFPIILSIGAGIVFGYKSYRATDGGRHATDKIFLKLPVIGNFIAMIQIAQFTRLLSMLLKSGVPIIDSLNIVGSALTNIHFKEVLDMAAEDLAKGTPLAMPLARSGVYPPLIVRMVEIGEETGKLDVVLEDMAKYYDTEVDEISDNLNKLMEPLILVVVGGVVAFLAIGIYLPIYSIGNNI